MKTWMNINQISIHSLSHHWLISRIFLLDGIKDMLKLRSFSIAYVFTRYLEDLTSNSLRKKVLNLAKNVIINLTSKFYDEETHNGDNNTKNKSFVIDELKLGFFFQHSPAHQSTLRQVLTQIVKTILYLLHNA